MRLEETLNLMIEAALVAGEEILKYYEKPFTAKQKQDGTPVTIADQNAENIILEFLAKTGLPVLAEESFAAGKIPELGDQYFVVDPLDGTKEFIKKNGEFTVNIALVKNGQPICGVVTAPALNIGYVGSEFGAFKFTINNGIAGKQCPIQVAGHGPINIVASRSHGSCLLDRLQNNMTLGKNVSVGSSLKFCMVATGDARLYPRFTPTSEWDIAAGQAVLQAAGGTLITMQCNSMQYGKVTSNFINPFFVAADNQALAQKTASMMAQLCEEIQ